jgi:Flp pilus assembly CpaF family ATPase
MIDMARIEKAHLRLQNLYNNLVMRVQEFEDDKTTKKKRYEIRCMNRLITILDDKDVAETLVNEINEANSSFMQKEYHRFLDEVDGANEK